MFGRKKGRLKINKRERLLLIELCSSFPFSFGIYQATVIAGTYPGLHALWPFICDWNCICLDSVRMIAISLTMEQYRLAANHLRWIMSGTFYQANWKTIHFKRQKKDWNPHCLLPCVVHIELRIILLMCSIAYGIAFSSDCVTLHYILCMPALNCSRAQATLLICVRVYSRK